MPSIALKDVRPRHRHLLRRVHHSARRRLEERATLVVVTQPKTDPMLEKLEAEAEAAKNEVAKLKKELAKAKVRAAQADRKVRKHRRVSGQTV